MRILAKRFVIEEEKGNPHVGKTFILRDTMTGHGYELDQYPSWERSRQGAARWIIHERYGEMLGKFLTKRGALNFLKKESDSKLKKVM